MKIFRTDQYPLPLPPGHRFPLEKYTLLRKRVEAARFPASIRIYNPRRVFGEEMLLVHDPEYVRRILQGEMSEREMRRIGFPWSPALVERTLRSAGATLEACFAALAEGASVCLSGGTHHAFRDRGEGYCILNDSAIAAAAVLRSRHADSILILDCDVHQGNGTAALMKAVPEVFTFSIHGRNNFPYRKVAGDIDIALEDRSDDSVYLEALKKGLDLSIEASKPRLVLYLAGADPFEEDRFGRLSLSKRGLAERDRMVLEKCGEIGAAVAVTMAGGYARRIEDTVDIHFETVRQVVEGRWKAGSDLN